MRLGGDGYGEEEKMKGRERWAWDGCWGWMFHDGRRWCVDGLVMKRSPDYENHDGIT